MRKKLKEVVGGEVRDPVGTLMPVFHTRRKKHS